MPDPSQLATMKRALPFTDLLGVVDLKTVGVLVRIKEESKLDTVAIKQVVSEIDEVVKNRIPAGFEHRIIGAPLMRQAIVRYNIRPGLFLASYACS